ncbi:hypothetical protein ABZX51_010524 [Aspergillus tubingensis]
MLQGEVSPGAFLFVRNIAPYVILLHRDPCLEQMRRNTGSLPHPVTDSTKAGWRHGETPFN